jgi:hypothetical protein
MSKGRRQPTTPAITITVREFTTAVPVLARLFAEARPADVRTTYRLAQLRRALAAHDAQDAPHNVVRRQLIAEHVVHDDQGQPVIEGNDFVFVSEGKRGAFLAGLDSIMSEVIEIAGGRLTLDDLAALALSTPLSVNELDAIAWLVCEPAVEPEAVG